MKLCLTRITRDWRIYVDVSQILNTIVKVYESCYNRHLVTAHMWFSVTSVNFIRTISSTCKGVTFKGWDCTDVPEANSPPKITGDENSSPISTPSFVALPYPSRCPSRVTLDFFLPTTSIDKRKLGYSSGRGRKDALYHKKIVVVERNFH